MKRLENRFDVGMGFVKRHDGGKFITEDNMILRRNVTCFQVEDQGVQRRVFRRETNEHSFPSTRRPFGNAFAILEMRIQNVDRASENMSSPKIRVIGAGARPELIWR
jgi:hypothetical protein